MSLLPKPITKKEAHIKKNATYHSTIVEMQGWRATMEDANCCFVEMKRPAPQKDLPNSLGLFGIFDGHGTTVVAQYAAKHILEGLAKRKEFSVGCDWEVAMANVMPQIDADMQKAAAFANVNGGSTGICVLFDPPLPNGELKAGTESDSKCASCGDKKFRHIPRIVCANVGDSRAIACDSAGNLITLSIDQKPSDAIERQRVAKAGGWVDPQARVNGILALTRALGDFAFKQQKNEPQAHQVISCIPDMTTYHIYQDIPAINDNLGKAHTGQSPAIQKAHNTNSHQKQVAALCANCRPMKLQTDDGRVSSFSRILPQKGVHVEFLFLACDGIWEVKSNKWVCAHVRKVLKATHDKWAAGGKSDEKILEGGPTDAIDQLFTACISEDCGKSAGVGCDNMSAMCILILNGLTIQQWYEQLAKHYTGDGVTPEK